MFSEAVSMKTLVNFPSRVGFLLPTFCPLHSIPATYLQDGIPRGKDTLQRMLQVPVADRVVAEQMRKYGEEWPIQVCSADRFQHGHRISRGMLRNRRA